MAVNRAAAADNRQMNPFRLKRKGAFSEALLGYARLYANSAQSGNTKVAELCFEQMFDIELLIFLKEQKQFRDHRELAAAMRRRLCEALEDVDCRTMEGFDSHLDDYKEHLLRGGGGGKAFSVDPHLLIGKHIERESAQSRGRGQPIRVDGAVYPSAREAYRTLLGEPTSQMNRYAIKRALARAGHVVSD